MSGYIVVTAHAWMNESGYGVNYASDMRQHPTWRSAARDGLHRLDHDDFLIGTISRSGALLNLVDAHGEPLGGWSDEDHSNVSDQLYLPGSAS